MKKVYVVVQFDATPYEHWCYGIHKVFASKESAEEYLKERGEGPHWEDDNQRYGYYLDEQIKEVEVHD